MEEKTKFRVFIQRTVTQEAMVDVYAENRYEAGMAVQKKAHENGDQFEWSTSESEVEIDEIREA